MKDCTYKCIGLYSPFRIKPVYMKYFLFLFLWMDSSRALPGQNPTPTSTKKPILTSTANPIEAGVSHTRLLRLDQSMKSLVDDQKLPGLVALVVRNGKIIYHKAHGYSDALNNTPMKIDDIFRIASMSKAITSTAVMMLYEEGKFSLDDPVSRWMPEFKNPQLLDSFNPLDSSFTTKPAKSEITIRQLLTHTSGIGYGAIDGDERFRKIYAKAGIKELYTTAPISTQTNIKKLGSLPLHHDPGARFTYSMGLDVIGYFIEIISGESFSDYLSNHLFKPMGMLDSYFYLPEAKKNRLVKIHSPGIGQLWTTELNEGYDPDYPIKGAKMLCSGGAGLSSTAKDYAVFLQMLLNEGVYQGKRFLCRTNVKLLTQSNQIGELFEGEKGQAHFSLAFSVLNKNGEFTGKGSEGRFSWGGYFNTNYWADPKEQIIAVLMKQTRNLKSDDSEALFTRMIYQSLDD